MPLYHVGQKFVDSACYETIEVVSVSPVKDSSGDWCYFVSTTWDDFTYFDVISELMLSEEYQLIA